MIPEKLYHATYAQFLDSIKSNGLGNTKNKMWTDSRHGVVYLANDPLVAESYAEESEWLDSLENVNDYLENIIILEVDITQLDKNKIIADRNVFVEEGDENSTWEYHGIIPWEACKILSSNTKAEHIYEWIDSKGNKISSFNNSSSKSTNSKQSTDVVYIWDIYDHPINKGTWRSAEKYQGEYDGFVYENKNEAYRAGINHLYELEDEGLLIGYSADYTVEVVAIPKTEVSDYTLAFSGIK